MNLQQESFKNILDDSQEFVDTLIKDLPLSQYNKYRNHFIHVTLKEQLRENPALRIQYTCEALLYDTYRKLSVSNKQTNDHILE